MYTYQDIYNGRRFKREKRNKHKRMGNIIIQIKPGGEVDHKSRYVWFKNNNTVFERSNDFKTPVFESNSI